MILYTLQSPSGAQGGVTAAVYAQNFIVKGTTYSSHRSILVLFYPTKERASALGFNPKAAKGTAKVQPQSSKVNVP